MEVEPLQWFKVTNPHAFGYERIGYLVKTIGPADDPDLRKRSYLIRFEDDDETLYLPDEITRIFVC